VIYKSLLKIISRDHAEIMT